MTIQECDGGGHGGDWEDPQAEIRSDALEYAVDLMSAGAHSDRSPNLTPEEAGKAAVAMARSFEAYLSGSEFLPMGVDMPDGPMG